MERATFITDLAGEEAARAAHRRHRRGGQRGRAARALRDEERDLRLRHVGPSSTISSSGRRTRWIGSSARRCSTRSRRSSPTRCWPRPSSSRPSSGAWAPRRGAGAGLIQGFPYAGARRGPQAQVGRLRWRVVADEVPAAEIAQRLLDLRAGVHDERAVARDGLAERPRGGEQEAAAAGRARGLHEIAVAEDDERRARAPRVRSGPKRTSPWST